MKTELRKNYHIIEKDGHHFVRLDHHDQNVNKAIKMALGLSGCPEHITKEMTSQLTALFSLTITPPNT